MNKRERLELTFSGEITDRVPVALWRHWPGDDQRAADLALAVTGFQNTYDWDFAVIKPARHYLVTGHGLQDMWTGDPSGIYTVAKTPIERSVDWTMIRPLDPTRGEIGKVVQCVQLLREPFTQTDTPHLLTIYSPLSQAVQLAGREQFLRHLRTQPDRVRTALNILTETTLRLIDALKRSGALSGILYFAEMADFEHLAEAEYASFGLPYDQKIVEALPASWWFNMLQVTGNAPMIHLFADMKVQVLGWQDQEALPALDRAEIHFRGALCGGLDGHKHLLLGTPSTIREAARKMMHLLPRRFILGCGSTVPVTVPGSNLRAVRDVVLPA